MSDTPWGPADALRYAYMQDGNGVAREGASGSLLTCSLGRKRVLLENVAPGTGAVAGEDSSEGSYTVTWREVMLRECSG